MTGDLLRVAENTLFAGEVRVVDMKDGNLLIRLNGWARPVTSFGRLSKLGLEVDGTALWSTGEAS